MAAVILIWVGLLVLLIVGTIMVARLVERRNRTIGTSAEPGRPIAAARGQASDREAQERRKAG